MTESLIHVTDPSMRAEILNIVHSIKPYDREEKEHLAFVTQWITSGAELFRLAKPATPNPHLVSYFLLLDEKEKKILLVDHKKAGLWLPSGGHVEPNEHPKDTVKREILEELSIPAEFIHEDPLFLTVTKTSGQTAGHTDVSLWYVLRGDSHQPLNFDKDEFHGVRWFPIDQIPENTDTHLQRFLSKLNSN